MDELRDQIERLVTDLGFDSMQLTLAEEACGIKDPLDMTAEQGVALVAYLKNELDSQVPV